MVSMDFKKIVKMLFHKSFLPAKVLYNGKWGVGGVLWRYHLFYIIN